VTIVELLLESCKVTYTGAATLLFIPMSRDVHDGSGVTGVTELSGFTVYKWTSENTAVQVAAVLWEVNDKPIQTGSVNVRVVEESVDQLEPSGE
jgi:hypothetical protein